MSDPDPEAAISDSAADMAAAASGGEGSSVDPSAAAEAAGEAAEEESKGFLSALFHTDPDLDPEQVRGPPWVGEAYVGTRKIMDALGVEMGEGDGDPAVANLYRAAVGAYQYGQERAESDGDGAESDGAPERPDVVTGEAQEHE